MADPETSMGGRLGAFPDTAWSTILGETADSPRRRDRLSRLCADYWRPVYCWIRAAWNKPVEDAKELTQEFFAMLLEQDVFRTYAPQHGRFRTFLKAVLRNFLAKEHRDRAALKRGGGWRPLPSGVEELEAQGALTDTRSLTPEQAFDLQWARDVAQRALVLLRQRLAQEGKESHLAAYEAYDLAKGERPTYDAVARALGLSVADVTNRLHDVRARFERIVREIASEYVSSDRDLAQEMQDLLSA